MFRKAWGKIKPRSLSTAEKVERAFGLWLVERKGSAAQFISSRTGVPPEDVWPILIEKRTNDAKA